MKHEPLWKAVKETGFPKRLGRLAMQWYTHPRRVVVDRSGTEEFSVHRTVVAGCGLATCLLRAMMLCVGDPLQKAFPAAKLKILVDDVSVQVVATRAVAVEYITRALLRAEQLLVRCSQLPLMFDLSLRFEHLQLQLLHLLL